MNPTLTKSVIALVPAGMVLLGSARIFFRVRAASSLLKLLGASGTAHDSADVLDEHSSRNRTYLPKTISYGLAHYR
jgi:hypothetical protein